MKFSLQNAALWITQLRCARSKSGQLREPTYGHGKEARAAAREPIRISSANLFPRTYLEKEESSTALFEEQNSRDQKQTINFLYAGHAPRGPTSGGGTEQGSGR